jgi:hypothetical protein
VEPIGLAEFYSHKLQLEKAMKTYLLRSFILLFTLLITSLAGCKKENEAALIPQLTCRTMEYVSLDGTSNANQYTYKLTYGADGLPTVIETVYKNFDPKMAQKTVWTYTYPEFKKVVIDKTFAGKPDGTITLTLDDQGRAVHRVEGTGSYDYEYDNQGYLAKIKSDTYNGKSETVLTAENGYLRSVQIGSLPYISTYTVTTDSQSEIKQPVPISFLGTSWSYLTFLGKPFRGLITAYTSGAYTYKVNNSLNVQGGLISREINYTEPTTGKPVSYLKETFTTVCQ